MRPVLQSYIDSGKVNLVYKHSAFLGQESVWAAQASECAADQGKFWDYHDLLYAKAPILDVPSLKTYAAQLGLNAVQFNQCLDSGQHAADVNRDLQDALAHHFNGTPSFLINGQPLAGPPSFETLQSLIDQILARGS